MNVSLAWLFDHINSAPGSCNVDELVCRFNEVTAEIEHIHRIECNWDEFELVALKPTGALAAYDGHGLPARLDLKPIFGTAQYALARCVQAEEKKTYRWASYADIGSDKSGLFPGVSLPAHIKQEDWKNYAEAHDILLEVDNKSLTHRPDMWGHRGFAREVAALLKLPFRAEKNFISDIPVKCIEASGLTRNIAVTSTGLHIENNAPLVCERLSVMEVPSITRCASDLRMALRLARVGTRAIELLVDLTNYVMLDFSQPMHAFDTRALEEGPLIVRMAFNDEKLTLLDDRTITLTHDDFVIANQHHAMGLAGVMGGRDCSVDAQTHSVIVESAHFAAEALRKMAMRHKTRTDASARFEKKLDPNQIIDAQRRFAYLAQEYGLTQQLPTEIICLGSPTPPRMLYVSHDYLVSRSGINLTPQDVLDALVPLGFEVTMDNNEYKIIVPSFRGTKDVTEPQDILEEVVRRYGFNRIVPVLPEFVLPGGRNVSKTRERRLKLMLCDGLSMSETCSYVFFNEDLVRMLQICPEREEDIRVLNPVSSQYVRLCWSLVPALLANVIYNARGYPQQRLFEFARVWSLKNNEIYEQKSLVGCLAGEQKTIDFYEGKAQLEKLFQALDMVVSWESVADEVPFWAHVHRVARIVHEGTIIGYAGLIAPTLGARLDLPTPYEIFIFELNGDYLVDYEPPVKRFTALPRFPTSMFDLSFMVPYHITVAQVQDILGMVDSLVQSVTLIDMFEKKEWMTERALTFHIVVGSDEGTLASEQIDRVRMRAITAVEALGATLRGAKA